MMAVVTGRAEEEEDSYSSDDTDGNKHEAGKRRETERERERQTLLDDHTGATDWLRHEAAAAAAFFFLPLLLSVLTVPWKRCKVRSPAEAEREWAGL